jgi:hypothetical protein
MDSFKQLINQILKQVQPYSKSIAATLAGLLVGWLYKHNIVIADDLNDAIEIILGAIMTGITVYFAPKNKG